MDRYEAPKTSQVLGGKQQRFHEVKESAPGPGAYEPKQESVQIHEIGREMAAYKSKIKREFLKISQDQTPPVGSYDSSNLIDGSKIRSAPNNFTLAKSKVQ